MHLSSRAKLALSWFALSAITLMSWWIGRRRGAGPFEPNAAVSLSVILIAAVKVRVIFREFMEIGSAPVLLKRLTDAWLGLSVVTLIALYLLRTR